MYRKNWVCLSFTKQLRSNWLVQQLLSGLLSWFPVISLLYSGRPFRLVLEETKLSLTQPSKVKLGLEMSLTKLHESLKLNLEKGENAKPETNKFPLFFDWMLLSVWKMAARVSWEIFLCYEQGFSKHCYLGIEELYAWI